MMSFSTTPIFVKNAIVCDVVSRIPVRFAARNEKFFLFDENVRGFSTEAVIGPFYPRSHYEALIRREIYVSDKCCEAPDDLFDGELFMESQAMLIYFENCIKKIDLFERNFINKEKAKQRRRLEQKVLPLCDFSDFNPYLVLDVDKIEACDSCVNKFVFRSKNGFRVQYVKAEKRVKLYPKVTVKESRQMPSHRNVKLMRILHDIIGLFKVNRAKHCCSLDLYNLIVQDLNLQRYYRPFIKYPCMLNILREKERLWNEKHQEEYSDDLCDYSDLLVHEFDVMTEDDTKVVFPEDYVPFCKINKVKEVENQMDEPHGDCQDLNVEQVSNVILTTHAEESEARPITLTQGMWESLCSPQKVQEYTQLMSRWQRYETLKWSKDFAAGKLMKECVLPIDFIKTNLESPSCILFSQYSFVRLDLEIKIVVNSNKFHAGSLQGSFYYGASMDAHYKDRSNIYSASQMTHCIIDAANATDGILKIPYRHYKPLMATTTRPDDSNVLDMGNFRLFVLNQLRVPENDTNEVDVSIFIRFVNPSFHGMKPRDVGELVENQMLGLASVIKETANLVNQVYPDPQRDNPTDPLPAKPMIPWSAHSWCVGDVLPEPSNPLRLQASGNTPHPPGTLPKEPEMEIDYVKRVFGLVTRIIWSTNQTSGHILYKIPFSPTLSEYPGVICSNPTARTCDVMPPVSVISQLFAYWRGSLEYRLDFIATMFHTGRLIIAYLPRVVLDKNPSLVQLTHCDHIIVDLRDEKQVIYVNSFLSDKPWYPRRKIGVNATENYPPGYIYIAVLNPLTATAAIDQEIDINLYLRAGNDFELHVPVNPMIGLSYNTDLVTSASTVISYLPSYGPPSASMYVGWWHTIGGNRMILRYGPTSDHVTQFPKIPNYRTVYKLSKGIINHPDTGVSLAFLLVYPKAGYNYGIPFATEDEASAASNWIEENGTFKADNEAKYIADIKTCKVEGNYLPMEIYEWTPTLKLDFEFIQQEAGDERKDTCGEELQVQNDVMSTNRGMLTFGEKISNFKQLVRRYQPYVNIPVKDIKATVPAGRADLVVPILPQGLLHSVKTTSGAAIPYPNMIRDGPIPLIASGYRFYRGDIRMRAIVGTNAKGLVWIQHRPDYPLNSLTFARPNPLYASGLYQPGYASILQLSQMNNVVEFEVPFYLPGQFGMLQTPDLTRKVDAVHYSLGSLYISFDSTASGEVKSNAYNLQLFYSMGDNMSFSVFQGFPPMIDLSIFSQSLTVENQMMSGLKQKTKDFFSDIAASSIKKTINEVMEEASVSGEQLADGMLSEPAKIETIIEKIFPEVTGDKKLLLLNTFSQLVHCAISPTLSSIALSICTVFVNLGVMAFNFIENMYNALLRFLKRFDFLANRTKKSNEVPEGTVIPNGPSEEEIAVKTESAFISTCVTGILAMVQAKRKPLPKTLPNFAAYLYDGLPKFTLTANGIFTFLRNNLVMFKKMWYWLMSKYNNEYIFYHEMEEAPEVVIKFIKDIQWCLNYSNRNHIRSELDKTAMVYELANTAEAYAANRALSKVKKPMPIFDSYCQKIIELRNKLSYEMISPAVRFEPLVISINGPSNVGKSHLAQTLSLELLEGIQYKTYGELVYTRTPGNQFWNGLSNQPICLFDDFLNIENTQHSLVSLGELFCLKSKAIFNPPMAAIEEKRLRYNPLLVLLCHNKAFPKISGLGIEEAWMRRRDIMIEATKKAAYKDKHPRQLTKKEKQTYAHLEFSFYSDPSGKGSRLPERETFSYEELLPRLVSRFNEYFREECVQYDDALRQARKFYPTGAETPVEFAARAKQELLRYNDSRIPPSERKHIHEILEYLHANQGGELSQTLQKHLVERKLKEAANIIAEPVPSISGVPLVPRTGVLVNFDTSIPPPQINPPPFNGVNVNEMSDPSCNVVVVPTPPKTLYSEEVVNLYGDRLTKWMSDRGCESLTRVYDYVRASINSPIFPHAQMQDLLPRCDCFIHFDNSSDYVHNSFSFNQNKGKLGRVVVSIDLCDFRVNRFGVGNTLEIDLVPCSVQCIYTTSVFQNYFWRCKIDNLSRVRNNDLDKVFSDNRLKIDPNADDNIEYICEDEVIEAVTEEVVDPKWYQKLWSEIPGWGAIIKWVLKGTAVVASLTLLFSAGLSLFNFGANAGDCYRSTRLEVQSKLQENKNRYEASYPEEHAGYSAGVVAAKVGMKVPVKRADAEANDSQSDVIGTYVRRNTFFLTVEYDGGSRDFRCLGLINRRFLVLDHYLSFIDSLESYELYFKYQNICLLLPPDTLTKNRFMFLDSTMVVGELPKVVPCFKNILKFFITVDRSANLAPNAILYELKEEKGYFVMNKHYITRLGRRERLNINNDVGDPSAISVTYSYPYSGRGMCMSVLVTAGNCPTPIIGIHVAGIKGQATGYAEAIVAETFASILMEETKQISSENGAPYDLDRVGKVCLDGNIVIKGTVPRSESVLLPKQSRLVPTDNAGYITSITYDKPVLSSRDERLVVPFSPLIEGCKHHTDPCFPMPSEFVKNAIEDVKEMILAHVKPQRLNVGKLSYEQAICGIRELPAYESMDMKTSEGYPWIKKRPSGQCDKSWMFTRELRSDGWHLLDMNKELFDVLEAKDLARKRGEIQETIFVDCLKDAKLPKEKVLEPGKTRIFSISPVDFTIHLRQYTYDFSVAFTACRIVTEHAVGIDIHSREANDLVEYMMQYGNHMICGDYSKFGDKLYAELVFAVFMIILEWYRLNMKEFPEYFKNVFECFAEETAFSTHLMVDFIYQCLGGMPSGIALTVIINSIVNCMYVRIVWQDICWESRFFSFFPLSKFKENVKMVVYGDDIWLVVKKDVVKWFNAETMHYSFAKYNIKFTNASKNEAILPYSGIEDEDNTTFLKCSFVRHRKRPNLWVAKLDQRSVEEICNWTWNKNKDLQASSIEACVAMLESAYGHGEDYYETLRTKVSNFWIDRGVSISIPSWSSVDIRIYEI